MPRIVSAFSSRNHISHIHKSVPEEQMIIHKSWRSFIAIVAIMAASVISINQFLKSKPACECIGSWRRRGGIHINKSMSAQDEPVYTKALDVVRGFIANVAVRVN
jgi:hypothetical protein